MVGGMISKNRFMICSSKSCSYTLKLKTEGIKTMNIENYLAEEIERISYDMKHPLYNRTYDKNQTTYFKLIFDPLVEKLDFSISLIPSTGNTGLYVNAKTKPLSLENYDWKETGPLAKRITVKWEELEQMKALKSDIYIAINQE